MLECPNEAGKLAQESVVRRIRVYRAVLAKQGIQGERRLDGTCRELARQHAERLEARRRDAHQERFHADSLSFEISDASLDERGSGQTDQHRIWLGH